MLILLMVQIPKQINLFCYVYVFSVCLFPAVRLFPSLVPVRF